MKVLLVGRGYHTTATHPHKHTTTHKIRQKRTKDAALAKTCTQIPTNANAQPPQVDPRISICTASTIHTQGCQSTQILCMHFNSHSCCDPPQRQQSPCQEWYLNLPTSTQRAKHIRARAARERVGLLERAKHPRHEGTSQATS